jgi:hypothetical protein
MLSPYVVGTFDLLNVFRCCSKNKKYKWEHPRKLEQPLQYCKQGTTKYPYHLASFLGLITRSEFWYDHYLYSEKILKVIINKFYKIQGTPVNGFLSSPEMSSCRRPTRLEALVPIDVPNKALRKVKQLKT